MNAIIEQLQKLTTVTWDWHLISKEARDELVKSGLVARAHGYNFLTEKGVEYLVTLRLLVP